MLVVFSRVFLFIRFSVVLNCFVMVAFGTSGTERK